MLLRFNAYIHQSFDCFNSCVNNIIFFFLFFITLALAKNQERNSHTRYMFAYSRVLLVFIYLSGFYYFIFIAILFIYVLYTYFFFRLVHSFSEHKSFEKKEQKYIMVKRIGRCSSYINLKLLRVFFS